MKEYAHPPPGSPTISVSALRRVSNHISQVPTCQRKGTKGTRRVVNTRRWTSKLLKAAVNVELGRKHVERTQADEVIATKPANTE